MDYDDLEKIVSFLARAEQKADEKIAALQYSKSKIQAAKADYEQKLRGREQLSGTVVKEIPERVILLSDTLEEPTLDNLWNYLSHFYEKVTPALEAQFSFEDLAGIYTGDDVTRLFAVCTRYVDIDGLRVLPKGRYLCAGCTEENRAQTLRELLRMARSEYGADPSFTVQLVIVSGILQWNYEVQVCIDP